METLIQALLVSVPIRGLFNLTNRYIVTDDKLYERIVSVPIRGLFNLTYGYQLKASTQVEFSFRPHQGII